MNVGTILNVLNQRDINYWFCYARSNSVPSTMEYVFLCENSSLQRRHCLPNSYKLLQNCLGLPISASFSLSFSSCKPTYVRPSVLLTFLIPSPASDFVSLPWCGTSTNESLTYNIKSSPTCKFPHRLFFVHTFLKPQTRFREYCPNGEQGRDQRISWAQAEKDTERNQEN